MLWPWSPTMKTESPIKHFFNQYVLRNHILMVLTTSLFLIPYNFLSVYLASNEIQGCRKVWKFGVGGAHSTVVGIICPPGDRVNCSAKKPPLATALKYICLLTYLRTHTTLWHDIRISNGLSFRSLINMEGGKCNFS